MATRFRADQVGSFLRPQEVLDSHIAHYRGNLPLEELRRIEDEAILKVLEVQKQAGIDVITDGEYRRAGWSSDFADAMSGGYVPGRPSVVLNFRGGAQAPSDGRPSTASPSATVPPGGGGGPGAGRVLGEPLVQKRRLTEYETAFLKQHADGRPWKVTMPAASYIVARGYNKELSDKAFGNRVNLLREVAGIIRAEIEWLVSEGCSYVQLDNPHYPDYIVDDRRAQWQAIGIDPEQAMREDVEADNACIEGLNLNGVTVGMHFCRGNGGRGGWHTEGGYDRIAETVFGGLKMDTLLLEYDSERAGTFEPLRFVPKGKNVVMGLITTKAGELEPQDLIERRIEEATKYIDINDLALSPQCGFASVMQGNPLTWDEQRRKLDLVVSTARKIWG